jgi:hypothetical protein
VNCLLGCIFTWWLVILREFPNFVKNPYGSCSNMREEVVFVVSLLGSKFAIVGLSYPKESQ